MGNISPKVDIAFKKIFGVEENKDLLISLINSIVSKKDQVADVTILNPYNPQSFFRDKLSILDIKAVGKGGKLFNIEIQITDEADYDKRALYYWGKLYTQRLKEGQGYSNLCKAIGIHILYFTSIPNSKKYHNVFRIEEEDGEAEFFTDLELHTIELTKFGASSKDGLSEISAKVKNSLDMWVAFLTRHDLLNKNNLPKELDDKNLKKALGVLDQMNFSSEEREAYEDHLKWFRMELSALEKVEAKGVAKGIDMGIDIGITNVAKNMLKLNLPMDVISEYTGLSLDKIKKLL